MSHNSFLYATIFHECSLASHLLVFLFYHNCEEISITVILQFNEISMKSIHPNICAIALYLKMKLR